jgi:hypothetical protein
MSTADQIRVAELTGAARHHAQWRPLTADEHAVAVAALREPVRVHQRRHAERVDLAAAIGRRGHVS